MIVHAWEQWGADCVKRFRGMFAFALWDRNRKTLFLARDRLGVKPLFWCALADGTFGFGSELKALKLLPGFDARLDDYAIEDYFAFGYIPDPKTIYRNAHKLEPAHTLQWSVGRARAAHRTVLGRFLRTGPADHARGRCASSCASGSAEAVRIRMISEVPLGAFLSGGVDSSAVVAAMAGLSSEPVKTCSIAFDVAEFDESRYAAMVAERYRTDHYVETVTQRRLRSDRHACPTCTTSPSPTARRCRPTASANSHASG